MPCAVGLSQTQFLSNKVGNLCRGKEWWIESEAAERSQELSRVIVSGVELQDERARQAKRGLSFSGRSLSEYISSLLVDNRIIACVEDGNLQNIPEGAAGVEVYQMSKLGFALDSWFVRWELECKTPDMIAIAIESGADLFLLNPQNIEQEAQDTENYSTIPSEFGSDAKPAILSASMKMNVHRLIGGRQYLSSGARYVADAIWDVLEECNGVILLHEDKHSRCFGVYSKTDVGAAQHITAFCEQNDILIVPFSIPPMLARWDRAIRDMRRDWDETENGVFPIPQGLMSRESEKDADSEEQEVDSETQELPE